MDHILKEGDRDHRYGHYGILLDRRLAWEEKEEVYGDFFDEWVRSNDRGSSWRKGPWFVDLDLSDYSEYVTWCYGEKPE